MFIYIFKIKNQDQKKMARTKQSARKNKKSVVCKARYRLITGPAKRSLIDIPETCVILEDHIVQLSITQAVFNNHTIQSECTEQKTSGLLRITTCDEEEDTATF